MRQLNKSGLDLISQMNNTVVPNGGIVLWHLGQEGMALKIKDMLIYFDPYLTAKERMPRNFPPPLLPEEVTNASYVFISHNHSDHLDPGTLKGIGANSPCARFICPSPHIEMIINAGIEFPRIIPAYAGKVIQLDGITITPVPCKHENYLIDEQYNHGFLGYVLDIEGLVFYHAGDALADMALVEVLIPMNVEIACLPINGHDFKRLQRGIVGNMNGRDAVELGRIIGADLIIPMHYDLFAFNTENPAMFVDYLYSTYPDQKYKMLVPGERMLHLSERLI
jgi:L-ascorbate 6-phosphate lactonase